MTTAAAPNLRSVFAWLRNFSSPSFIEMELTMHLPCTHLRPATTVSQRDESIITGTFAISGSAAMRLRNFVMHFSESSMPSSMLTSMICAPPSTCCRATLIASSYFSSLMRRLNFAEPVTLVLSPTFMKSESSVMLSGSSPERRQAASCL